MRSGRTVVRASARKSDTDTLSSDWMKTRNAPARMPGINSGRVTRRSVMNQLAPIVVDASASEGLRPWATTEAARYISGPKTTTWPATVSQSDGLKPMKLATIKAARP